MAAQNLTAWTTISKTPSHTPDIARRWFKQSMVLSMLAMIVLTQPMVTEAGVRDDHPNLVGGELMGRGIFLTLNYERFLTNHFGVGGGVMAIGTSDGVVSIIPLYVSLLMGDVHSFYLGAGGTFVGGGGSVNDYRSTWIMQGSVGYQFQSKSGFFVRPLFTFNHATTDESGDQTLFWPGLTIGGSF